MAVRHVWTLARPRNARSSSCWCCLFGCFFFWLHYMYGGALTNPGSGKAWGYPKQHQVVPSSTWCSEYLSKVRRSGLFKVSPPRRPPCLCPQPGIKAGQKRITGPFGEGIVKIRPTAAAKVQFQSWAQHPPALPPPLTSALPPRLGRMSVSPENSQLETNTDAPNSTSTWNSRLTPFSLLFSLPLPARTLGPALIQ